MIPRLFGVVAYRLLAVDKSAPRLRVPLGPLLLLARLSEATLRPLGIQPQLHPRRMDFFIKSFSFSVAEARRLGYAPKTTVDEGMRETARWYLERELL